jgi:hypothetical protein
MKSTAKFCIAALAAAACSAAGAQDMYKCKDAKGRITYASNECSLLGLLPAGEITGRASVAPAQKVVPFRHAPESAPAAPAAPAAAPQGVAAGDAKADADDKRCFKIKTAKGSGTRCNDKPEE